MRNLKFINILLLISLLIGEEKSWATTTFEYYWNLGTNKIRFIEPVRFTPFETKIGYLTYGGSDYWDDLISTKLGNISPVVLDSTNNSFNYLNSSDARILAFIEFDFMKFNLPNFLLKKIGVSQNIFDVQIGLGYRYIHSISEPKFPNYWENTIPDNQNLGQLLFKPRINDFNFNASIDYQILSKIRTYFHYSLGYAFGTVYEYSGTGNYLKCNGISEGIGAGLRYIAKLEKYDFNLIYGLEYRLQRTYIGEIEDPSKISHIIGLDMYSKGIVFSIGTILGGNKTSADHSFLKLLNKKYISAEPGFEKYINSMEPRPRKKLAQKMLNFTRTQIPYEQYQYGLENQSLNKIDSAIYWFNQSIKTADEDLLFEIKTHQKDLAIILIDSVKIYKNNLTFDQAEQIIKKAKILADDYYYVNEMLANLYIEKGDVLKNVGNYNKANDYYNKAKNTYPDSNIKLIEKYYSLADKIIEKGKMSFNNNEYPLSIELFNLAININPNKKDELQPIIDDLYSKMTIEESKKIKENIKNIVEEKKTEIDNILNTKILIGMSSNEVQNRIGKPTLRDIIEKGNRIYELWTYEYPENKQRIYFENNLVIKIE